MLTRSLVIDGGRIVQRGTNELMREGGYLPALIPNAPGSCWMAYLRCLNFIASPITTFVTVAVAASVSPTLSVRVHGLLWYLPRQTIRTGFNPVHYG